MITCEIALVAVLSTILVTASISDCTKGIISNWMLFCSVVAAMIINIIYYFSFARDWFSLFVSNCIMLSIMGILLYCLHVWAAGDSKMFFAISICLPGRLYSLWDSGSYSSFLIIIFTFAFAFLYIAIESVFLGLKNKSLFKFELRKVDWKQCAVSYLAIASAVALLNIVFSKLSFARSAFLISAINFCCVLLIVQLINRVSRKWVILWTIVSWTVILALWIVGVQAIKFKFRVAPWIIILAIMFFRMVSEQYNYKVIATESVEAGQILAFSTIVDFLSSNVTGLPKSTTEDNRSRITEEEADSIKRWRNSAHGRAQIVIVRKIPFAVFISVGTIIFLLVEVFGL